MIEAAVITVLGESAPITALVGSRISAAARVEGDPLPSLHVLAAGEGDLTLAGDIVAASVTIVACAVSPLEALTLSLLVVDAFAPFIGVRNGVKIFAVMLERRDELDLSPGNGDDAAPAAVAMGFEVFADRY